MTDRLTDQQLDDIETRAASLHEYATLTDGPLQADADQMTGEDVPALLAEIRRLHGALAAAVRKDVTSPLAVIAKHGEMPESVRQEINDLLADAEESHVVADDSDDPEHIDDCPGCEATDTLPAWLAQRFDPRGPEWDALADDDRSHWEHQARAVRRAVARGGFKAAEGAQR